MMHQTEKYLLNPQHPVTVSLVGCGGTGSQMLTNLGRIDFALKNLGHPGMHVTAFDPDEISESNIGRQLFSPADIGQNKATVLITRVNRFYGLDWEAVTAKYSKSGRSNIIISCVDTARARIEIEKTFPVKPGNMNPYDIPFYWLDIGNTQRTGQVVLGTVLSPKGIYLPNIIKMFPDIEAMDNEEDQGPSCSLAQALTRQDLFINSTLATLAADLLWKLFREMRLNYHGVFVNLDTMKMNPISVGGE